MSAITDAVVERAYQAQEDWWQRHEGVDDLGAMRAALEAVEGHFEQHHENCQVRLLRKDHRCPVCGSEA